MLDALPFHQSMKAAHRVRRFRHGNAEHPGLVRWSKGRRRSHGIKHYNPTEEIAA